MKKSFVFLICILAATMVFAANEDSHDTDIDNACIGFDACTGNNVVINTIKHVLNLTDQTYVGSFVAPDGAIRGLTFDGTYLWAANSGDGNSIYGAKIWKVDAATGAVLGMYDAPGAVTPTGLAWDGAYLWHVDFGTDLVYKIDTATMTVVSSFPAPHGSFIDLAWDGEYLYGAAGSADMIIKFDTISGAPLDTIFATYTSGNVAPYGLAYLPFNSGQVWTSDGNYGSNMVNEWDIAASSWINQWAPNPAQYPCGLAYDPVSGYLWISCWTTDSIYIWDVGSSGPAVSILYVDDDADPALSGYFETSLGNNGYAYDMWVVVDSGGTTPNASQMGAYDIVVWTTGEDYMSTLVGSDTTNIGNYLAAGGAMWLASQDVLYDIGAVSWMHVSAFTSDIGCTQATGIGPIMTGASYATTGGAMYDYSDQITGDGSTWAEMQNQSAATNTIAMDPGSGTAYKLFFNAFGFENINDVADRDDMVYRVIEWLKPSGVQVHDVGSFAFLSPGTQVSPAYYDVIGVVKNYGDFEETYDVHCVVTDPTFAVVLDETFSVTTPVGENDTITFGNIEFVDGYTYDLVMATLLSGDENTANDTLEQSTFVTSWFWESWTNIDQGRSGPYAGFWNIDGQSYVYYWGGNPGPLATGFKYDGSGWTAVPSMPVGSSYGGDMSFDGKIYLVSAWTGQNGMLTIFDCESETFSSGTNLPTPVADPACALYQDNYIYCIGGSNPPGWAGSTIVQVYDIASDTWLTGVTQLPGASLVSTAEAGYIGNDTIIVSGGYDTGATNKTTMGAINPANPAEVTWSTGTPHPGVAAYRNFGGAGHNDAGDYWFMVAGGSPYVNQAAIYQSNAGWITAPNKITACSNSGAVVGPWESLTDDAEIWLYTIAGYTGAYLNIFEVFHTGAWTGIMEQPDDNITVFDFSARTINPVKDQVRFTLSMPYQGEVSFQVFDVTGRQVIDTRYSSISQGEHTLFWNLKDAQQRNVAAGTYFYRFQAGEHTATGKLVVVR